MSVVVVVVICASCVGYCLISYRAGAWHYRIFLDFLNSGFKMASKIEGKAKVIAISSNDIETLKIRPETTLAAHT